MGRDGSQGAGEVRPGRFAGAARIFARIRLPLVGLCAVGAIAGFTLPTWSGWWTHHVQASKAAAFSTLLASAPAQGASTTPLPPGSAPAASRAGASAASVASAVTTAPPAASTSASSAAAVAPGGVLAELQIPSVGVDSLVLEGLTFDPSVWESLLRQGPAHMEGSALPGQPGNAVVFGHLNIWGSVFYHLADVHKGDTIRLLTPAGTFTYLVSGQRSVAQTDLAAVAPVHKGPATLELVTCEGVAEQDRLIVDATLQQPPKGTGL